MARVREILQLYEYNRWANHRVLDAASALWEEDFTRDLGSSFGSVRDTLVHILASEWIWLSRWEGRSPREIPHGWATSGYAELRSHWTDVEERQRRFVAELTDARLDEVVSYRNTSDEQFHAPLWQMLRHVVNHSTYHRGQVITMLRQLGAEACSTDLILFFRSTRV
jgi:uncharacterized damage-inducible protein DinB